MADFFCFKKYFRISPIIEGGLPPTVCLDGKILLNGICHQLPLTSTTTTSCGKAALATALNKIHMRICIFVREGYSVKKQVFSVLSN